MKMKSYAFLLLAITALSLFYFAGATSPLTVSVGVSPLPLTAGQNGTVAVNVTSSGSPVPGASLTAELISPNGTSSTYLAAQHYTGALVKDSTALYGEAVTASSVANSLFVWGPGITLPAGAYLATYNLKLNSTPSGTTTNVNLFPATLFYSGEKVSDPTAYQGEAVESNGHNPMVWGPYIALPAGRYNVLFNLKLNASVTNSSEEVAVIDASSDMGAVTLGSENLYASQFHVGQWQNFTLSLDLAHPAAYVEFRVFSSPGVQLECDYREVENSTLPVPVATVEVTSNSGSHVLAAEPIYASQFHVGQWQNFTLPFVIYQPTQGIEFRCSYHRAAQGRTRATSQFRRLLQQDFTS